MKKLIIMDLPQVVIFFKVLDYSGASIEGTTKNPHPILAANQLLTRSSASCLGSPAIARPILLLLLIQAIVPQDPRHCKSP
jgi:hypothetical protein